MINYTIDDEFGGVPEGDRYVLQDTPGSEGEWRALLAAFTKEFSEFKASKDFDFPDWHYKMRSLGAYLYNEKFYNEDFIPKVNDILKKQNSPAYAHFECYDSNAYQEYGSFMVFNDSVIFNRLSEESGLLRRLIRNELSTN